tara:strand:- start:1554 stop:2162 length:609 start_codon:yes stop_codon:yes gene_type:complete
MALKFRGKLRLKKPKAASKPKKPKRTPKASRKNTKEPRQPIVRIKYPDEDLSEYRPEGTSTKAKAARKVFDNWPEEAKWSGKEILEHISFTLKERGFRFSLGFGVYLKWLMSHDGNVAGHSRNNSWPHPRSMLGDSRKSRAWEAKREFGIKWKNAIMTPAQYLKDKKVREIERLENEARLKNEVAIEYGKKIRGIAFPRKKV